MASSSGFAGAGLALSAEVGVALIDWILITTWLCVFR